MKALSLTQPYATLIALGAKRIETRSWATPYRGPLLIHAAKGLGPVGGKRGLWELCDTDPFHDIIHRHCLPTALPLGAIVAVCELRGCVATEAFAHIGWVKMTMFDGEPCIWPLTAQEYVFGDYSPGRFAWLLGDVRALPEPIPAKGALGLWEYDGAIPDIS